VVTIKFLPRRNFCNDRQVCLPQPQHVIYATVSRHIFICKTPDFTTRIQKISRKLTIADSDFIRRNFESRLLRKKWFLDNSEQREIFDAKHRLLEFWLVFSTTDRLFWLYRTNYWFTDWNFQWFFNLALRLSENLVFQL
jgi:hypothetical protein